VARSESPSIFVNADLLEFSDVVEFTKEVKFSVTVAFSFSKTSSTLLRKGLAEMKAVDHKY